MSSTIEIDHYYGGSGNKMGNNAYHEFMSALRQNLERAQQQLTTYRLILKLYPLHNAVEYHYFEENHNIIRTDLVEFFDCVAFNSISYDMHKQYPHLNQLFIGGLSLPLIGCWTRLNYARTQLTKIYQRMKNLPGYS